MEQENRPSAPQQVVNISQVPMEDNKTLKDAYSSTAATILGVLQIIIGVVFFFGEIDISFRIIVLTCNFSAFFPFSLTSCLSTLLILLTYNKYISRKFHSI